MPMLPNSRHEKFCQELAKGKSQTEAYELAGYKGDRTAASRLSTNGNIIARVAELQERGARRVEVTVESLIAEIEEARQLALANKQAAAAVAATREKGVLAGKRVERSEQGKPGDFDRMDDHELDAFITAGQDSAGSGHSRETSEERQAGMRKPSGLH